MLFRSTQGEPRVTTVTHETPTTAPAGQSGGSLNDEGFRRIQAGDYQGALPLLEQAVSKLDGTGSLAEAYADYNLAFTRFALGSCDGVLGLLDRSEAVQGRRHEIDSLRKRAERGCDGSKNNGNGD